eukprot:763792-Hanusia_phi.AAC.2
MDILHRDLNAAVAKQFPGPHAALLVLQLLARASGVLERHYEPHLFAAFLALPRCPPRAQTLLLLVAAR